MKHYLSFRIFTLLVAFVFAGPLFSQPLNQPGDNLCNPIALQALGQPQPCALGGQAGTISFSGSTFGMQYSTPPVGGHFPSTCLIGYGPDMFYSFVATTNTIRFSFNATTATFLTPVIALYEKTGPVCDQVTPRGCWGAGPSITDTFKTLTPGKEYYICIAGTAFLDTGSFVMSLQSFTDCNSCLRKAGLITYPPPVDGYYPPNTTVTFCYTITDIEQALNGPSLHCITPKYGPGWVQTSVQPVSAANTADSMGNWQWYTNVNTSVGSLTGYFYESTLPLTNNPTTPTDNFGDRRPFNNTWTFCWKATTDTSCTLSSDLTYSIEHYMDNVTGVSTVQGCASNPEYFGAPAMVCCNIAQVSSTPVTCNGSGYNSDGTITISISSINNCDVIILDSDGDTAFSGSLGGTSTFPGVSYGYYSVIIYDPVLSCHYVEAVKVFAPFTIDAQQNIFGCSYLCEGGALMTYQGNLANYNVEWFDANMNTLQPFQQPNNAQAIELCDGWHFVKVTDPASGCVVMDSVNVQLYVGVVPEFHYTTSFPDSLCAGTYPVAVTPTPQGGHYILETQVAGVSVDSLTGLLTVLPQSNDTDITIKYFLATNPCPAIWLETIHLFQSGSGVTVTTDQIFGCVGTPLSSSFAASPVNQADSVNWYAQPGQQGLLQSNSTSFAPFITPTSSGIFTYYVSATGHTRCPGAEDSVHLTVYNPPSVNAGADVTICPGDNVQLSVLNASSAIWSPQTGLSNAFSLNPVADPSQTTQYTVIGYDGLTGCYNVDSVNVIVGGNDCGLYAWGGITPNGDGKNEEWIIEGIDGYLLNRVLIYNRWGGLIWSTINYDNADNVWRGQSNTGEQVPPGTYFYVIELGTEKVTGWVEVSR